MKLLKIRHQIQQKKKMKGQREDLIFHYKGADFSRSIKSAGEETKNATGERNPLELKEKNQNELKKYQQIKQPNKRKY